MILLLEEEMSTQITKFSINNKIQMRTWEKKETKCMAKDKETKAQEIQFIVSVPNSYSK